MGFIFLLAGIAYSGINYLYYTLMKKELARYSGFLEHEFVTYRYWSSIAGIVLGAVLLVLYATSRIVMVGKEDEWGPNYIVMFFTLFAVINFAYLVWIYEYRGDYWIAKYRPVYWNAMNRNSLDIRRKLAKRNAVFMSVLFLCLYCGVIWFIINIDDL